MAYLGQAPFQEYSSVPTKDNFTGDGSTTAFDLANTVPAGAENALEVYVNNVRQEPGTGKAFTLGVDGSGDLKRITFATAPTNTHAIYVINDKTNATTIAPTPTDLNGSELILDADADTSITADTDDRIDFKIANYESISFSNSSGDAIIKAMTDAKDIKFQQYDGRTLLDINDGGYIGIANGATGPGQLRIYEDTDLGTNYTALQVGTQSGDITYTLPTADGSSGQLLSTNGSGTLAWAAAGSLGTDAFSNDANNRVVTGTGSSTLNGEANLTFNGSTLAVTGAVNVSTDLDVDGTANLDAVDIDGAVQLDSTLTIGANDQGYDVILYGDTASANLTWDTSADDLILNGAAGLIVPVGQLTLGSTAVTSTAAELNLLDGVSGLVQADLTKLAAVDSTAAELNIVDGGTSASSVTVADADRVVMNDGGTMKQVAVTDLAAYFDDEITAMPNLTSVGTLTTLAVDDVAINGKVMTMTGSSSDTAVFTAGTNGTLSIVTTDAAAAAANIQITADGTAELAGTTVTLDSSGGITLDADGGTITFADGGSSLGTITSSGYSGTAAAATTVTITDNESTDENNVIVFVAGADADGGTGLGLESDGNLNYNPSSGTLNVPNISVTGTQTIVNSVTMNASNAVIFEGATADAHETTLSSIDATGDRTINLPNVSGTLPVLAAASATQITSTPEELNKLDGATVTVGEINLIDGGATVGTTAFADGDGLLHNDNGTMKQTSAATLKTYMMAGTLTTAAQTNITSVGTLSALTVDNMAFNGNTLTTTSSDFIIDASHDIILDADGADIVFKDGGTQTGLFTMDSSNLTLQSSVSDKDLIFKGNDGGSTITALTLDMSDAGTAIFNHDINLADNGKLQLGSASGGDCQIVHDGTNTIIHNTTGDLIIRDTAGDIKIQAKSGEESIICNDDGSVELYHNNVKKFETQSDHVQITGHCYASGGRFGLDANDHIDVETTTIQFYINGGEEMRLEADGDLHVDGDVIAFSTTISDERLKHDIEPITDALDKVKQLNGVTFTYNADDKKSAGLIAQDVEKVLPSAVSEKELLLKENDGKKYKVLQYDQTIGLLVESIKELSTALEEATKRIETLENR